MPITIGPLEQGAGQFETLLAFVRLELVLLPVALLIVVAYQLLTGRIHLAGLLEDSSTGRFSSTRLQLLVFTFIGVIEYLSQVSTGGHTLPEIPETLLVVVIGGSNALYLVAKASPLLRSFVGNSNQ